MLMEIAKHGLKRYPAQDLKKGSPRDRLLQAASDLFCRYGINAVGVDTVVEQAGTAKTTLYKLFGSKEGLVLAFLEEEGRAWREWFAGRLYLGEASAKDRLDRVFPLLGEWFAEQRYFGCPFINAIAEHDKTDDRIRNLALAHKQQVLAHIRQLAADAGASDPDALTHEAALLMDGAIVAAMVTKDPGVAASAGKAFDCILLGRIAGAHQT